MLTILMEIDNSKKRKRNLFDVGDDTEEYDSISTSYTKKSSVGGSRTSQYQSTINQISRKDLKEEADRLIVLFLIHKFSSLQL